MTTEQIFTDLGQYQDFREQAKSLGVSMSTYLASLIAQAKHDKQFLLASRVEHLLRSRQEETNHAKQESSRKANLQSMDGRGTARANLRDRQVRNRGQRK